MKYLIIITFFLALSGCSEFAPKKPFVVTRKEYADHATYYQYRDAVGKVEDFYERDTIYFIGDTIK